MARRISRQQHLRAIFTPVVDDGLAASLETEANEWIDAAIRAQNDGDWKLAEQLLDAAEEILDEAGLGAGI